MRPRRNRIRSLSGGVLLIFLALAFFIGGSGHFFLPLLFVGLAFVTLLSSLGSGRARGAYGGLQGFIWLLGLAFCFVVGFWPWILVIAGLSAIAGAFAGPIIAALLGVGLVGTANPTNSPPQAYYTPPQQPQQPYQPYEQGYQPPAQTYQEGERQYPYPQQYEQPQAQYPQEMPPPQQ